MGRRSRSEPLPLRRYRAATESNSGEIAEGAASASTEQQIRDYYAANNLGENKKLKGNLDPENKSALMSWVQRTMGTSLWGIPVLLESFRRTPEFALTLMHLIEKKKVRGNDLGLLYEKVHRKDIAALMSSLLSGTWIQELKDLKKNQVPKNAPPL